ncbi:hypothetical protein Henu3_gp88 [Mycobacterium phage Henu3]|uniref:Uncharacterized protein n=1 Tax=Mycobacterium phage Henu3 TaxID=2492961 RepID=A0A410T7Z0_9CAUD|nr:hypothetical protein I5G68_gp75 [Mycobacterium phage Henu3]QAU05020.1 hypothetical protein Henu3_gp88 [Mycobacterium phage Henu3]
MSSLPIVNPPHRQPVARLPTERAVVEVLHVALHRVLLAVRQLDHVTIGVIALRHKQIQLGDGAAVERRRRAVARQLRPPPIHLAFADRRLVGVNRLAERVLADLLARDVLDRVVVWRREHGQNRSLESSCDTMPSRNGLRRSFIAPVRYGPGEVVPDSNDALNTSAVS